MKHYTSGIELVIRTVGEDFGKAIVKSAIYNASLRAAVNVEKYSSKFSNAKVWLQEIPVTNWLQGITTSCAIAKLVG